MVGDSDPVRYVSGSITLAWLCNLLMRLVFRGYAIDRGLLLTDFAYRLVLQCILSSTVLIEWLSVIQVRPIMFVCVHLRRFRRWPNGLIHVFRTVLNFWTQDANKWLRRFTWHLNNVSLVCRASRLNGAIRITFTRLRFLKACIIISYSVSFIIW